MQQSPVMPSRMARPLRIEGEQGQVLQYDNPLCRVFVQDLTLWLHVVLFYGATGLYVLLLHGLAML